MWQKYDERDLKQVCPSAEIRRKRTKSRIENVVSPSGKKTRLRCFQELGGNPARTYLLKKPGGWLFHYAGSQLKTLL